VRRLGLRARVAVAAAAAIVLAVVLLGVAVLAVLRHELYGSLDSALRDRAVEVARLSASAPRQLLVPGALEGRLGGSSLLVQVVDRRGRIVVRSAGLGGRLLPEDSAARSALKNRRPAYADDLLGSDPIRVYAAPLGALGHGPAAGGAVILAGTTHDIEDVLDTTRGLVVVFALAAAALAAAHIPLGYAYATFALGVFVLATVVQEFWRGVRARQAMLHESAGRALGRLIDKNRRRYGGYIVHVGVVAIFVGIAASSAFRIETRQSLKAGEEMQAGKFTLRYERIASEEDAHLSRLSALVSVWRNGTRIATLAPEKRLYKKPQQPTTEVAMRSTLTEDLYLVLGSYDPSSGLVTIQAYVNPLVAWLWIGGLIMVVGTVVTMWPSAAERRAVAYELGGARVAAE
jgi:hypothetical protein